MARPSNEGTDRAYSGVITAILSKPLAFKPHGAERPQSVGCDNKARRDQMGHDQAMSGTDSAACDGKRRLPRSVGCDNKARRDQMGHEQAMSGTDNAAYDGKKRLPQNVGCDNKARRDQMGHDQAMSGTDSAACDGVGGRLAFLRSYRVITWPRAGIPVPFTSSSYDGVTLD